jgi:hypothetical protein
MNAAGSWTVTIVTPMGPQTMQLAIVPQGDGFSGRIDGAMGSQDVRGSVSGNTLGWTMELTQPIPITVIFAVVVAGDRLSGTAALGAFGTAPVTGQRNTGQRNAGQHNAGQHNAGQRNAGAAPPPAPVQVTAESVDPRYDEPYVEVDELRSEPAPHRYVHGGFRGTDARFSFYFPPKERYRGRFFHNTYPMATSSDVGPFPIAFEVATGDLGFTFDSGAYYVQTNLGGTDRAPPADVAIGAYRVNAAAAKYSRQVAAGLYGEHRAFGYLFGGSGGAYQTIGSAENTAGVWDGFVPFVMGSPHAVPSLFTIRMHALRVLRQRDKFPAIMDAIDPGGSGDPYAELNDEERAALKEATLLGFPPRGWFAHETLTSGYFSNIAPLMPLLDPTYVEDFWTKPGYLGADPNASIRSQRFQFDTDVAAVIAANPRQFRLAAVPDRDFTDSHLVVLSGAAAGKSIPIASIDGPVIGFAFAADQNAINDIKAGDKVRIDNSWALALQTYHRHQLPPPDLYGWNQYRGPDGAALYPQRGILIGPIATAGTAGSVSNGRIHGKVLLLQVLMDIDALPWQADWYRSKVKEQLGPDFENDFVLWYIDHAQHDNPATLKAQAHTVSFAGALQQALRDLSAWVEKGVRPPDTAYAVIDTQVHVPAGAAARKGIQPVVTLAANGGVRAGVAAGEAVTFTAMIEVPPGAGKVVAAEWDFEGVGTYPVTAAIGPPAAQVRLTASHAYAKPGTYFPVLRAASQREGDTATPYARVQNIARVRVVVT